MLPWCHVPGQHTFLRAAVCTMVAQSASVLIAALHWESCSLRVLMMMASLAYQGIHPDVDDLDPLEHLDHDYLAHGDGSCALPDRDRSGHG